MTVWLLPRAFLCTATRIIGVCVCLTAVLCTRFSKMQLCYLSCHKCARQMTVSVSRALSPFVERVVLPPSGPGGIPPRGLLGDGPNDPRGGTLLSVTGEVIDPK